MRGIRDNKSTFILNMDDEVPFIPKGSYPIKKI